MFEKFEGKLEEHHGNLQRAAVELAKDWRQDRVLRRLEAMMIVMDSTGLLLFPVMVKLLSLMMVFWLLVLVAALHLLLEEPCIAMRPMMPRKLPKLHLKQQLKYACLRIIILLWKKLNSQYLR